MVNRSMTCLPLAAVLLWMPSAARAGASFYETSSLEPQVASILSYSAPAADEPAGSVENVQEQRASSQATEDCRGCHEDNLNLYNRTYHAAQEESCFSCHKGAAAEEHLKGQQEGNDVPGPSIAALDSDAANEICLSCHESSHHPTWEGGMHQRRDVKCIDCHSVHAFRSEKSQLKQVSASETCSACHPAIRAMSLRTSHHPVREGLMGCESCHNPHDGSRPKMIKADWANELCLQCHTEKRGPFLWEHAPVRESCLNCHNPHGSNHDKLLVAKPPYLCQRCHLNTRHPGTLYDGVNAAGTIEGRTDLQALALASNRAVEHACKNCHQNIHGGNAPSGPYLGR